MRKKLLLLSTVLAVSANTVFAQEKTVYSDDNNITYTYSANSDVTTTAQGQSSLDNESNRENIVLGSTLSIDYVSFTRVANRNRDIKLTVSDINDYSILPSQLQSFTRAVVSGEDLTNEDLNTTLSSFATDNRLNYPRTQRNNLPPSEMYYKIRQNTNAEKAAYATYQNACEKARTRGLYVYTGAELLEEGVDFDLYHMQINEGLYYIDAPDAVNVILINATTGNWKEGTTYLNCTDNFIPTYIGSNIPLPTTTASDEDSKVGIVSGLVDLARFNNIVAGKAFLNYDFTGTTIVGSINSSTVGANRLAYFANNADVSGQNIVVGNTCSSYVISDNNQEIYVYKQFSAGDAQYKRSFTPDTYGTIVLPFAVSNPGKIFERQAVFTGYSSAENKMTFSCTSMIAPNTPHLFKVLPTFTGESTLYGPVNGTIEATAEAKSAKYEGAQFAGTFEGLRAEIASQVYVVGAVGKIGRTTKALKPGRCYFTRENPDNFARSFDGTTIEFIDEDGTTTINEHELNESHELSGAVYDLQGRRVANGQKPTAKGLYIVNGKKIVIK
jgi:hypothetical protein